MGFTLTSTMAPGAAGTGIGAANAAEAQSSSAVNIPDARIVSVISCSLHKKTLQMVI
jgi:hypothetical protein